MVESDSEFLEFAIAYSKNAREIRYGLPEDVRAVLMTIEDELADYRRAYGHRTIKLTEDMFIYRYPHPQIELTCKIDDVRKVIHVLHVVAPTLQVNRPVFISYSHKDLQWLNELRKWLKPLEQKEMIKIWDDQEIKAGDRWYDEIQNSLSSAKAALLLVSQDFLVSEFIMNEELPKLLEAANARGVKILWIAVSPSTVEDTVLVRFQAVNDPTHPLDLLPESERRQEFLKIYKQIKEVIERF